MRDKKLKVDVLSRIIEQTEKDLEERKQQVPLSVILNSFHDLSRTEIPKQSMKQVQDMVRNDNERVQNGGLFERAIKHPKSGKLAIIAEVKFASPSESHLGNKQDIQKRAKAYEEAGADCISVVTEKHFFKGDPSFISQIKSAVSLPVLQKDFILDLYQLYEAKRAGSDAILLIAKILSKKNLASFVQAANTIGLETVVETNSKDDLEKAIATETRIIAVNARDLDTFTVDVDRACELIKMIPDTFIKLGFSGVQGREEAEKYSKAGADGVLIGTSLMKTDSIKEFIPNLFRNLLWRIDPETNRTHSVLSNVILT